MSALARELSGLMAWLSHLDPPPAKGISILEVDLGAAWGPAKRSDLRTPELYEARFESLITSGLPWINLSCYGLDGDMMIVAVELPRQLPDGSTQTSVNFSGPSRAALKLNWSAAAVFDTE